MRNGRLVFLRPAGENRHRQTIWKARCDCGQLTTTARPNQTQSCGCLHREISAQTQRNKALPPEERRRRELANRETERRRRKQDPVIAMQARLSRLHRHALARVGAIKRSPTLETLGYTAPQLAMHVERQFLPGMNWQNMDRWELDHIIPSSEAQNENDVIALNQLSNLRPMWSTDNNRKKNRRLTLL